MAKIKITQVKSTIDRPENQKRIIKALGFRKLNQSIVKDDSPEIMGMVAKVNHLIKIEQA
jgi:large subunit ribosomal protein L30